MSEVDSNDVLVSFRGVQKSYDGENLIVKDLNLEIRKGEFLTLLGPSGSGKTTSLMMLAGFETPTAGEIQLAGRSINNVPPHKRDIGMVFQNYALFPHMTVAENLAFPLSVRGLSKTDVSERVKRVLSMVQLDAFAQRYPAQLSGGQQQRVALARALVFEPQLVLMDEPLGALTSDCANTCRWRSSALHQRLGVTVVYVIHDQGEALTMSDRVAVFRRARSSRSPRRARCMKNRRTPSSLSLLARTTASTAACTATPATAAWSSWRGARRLKHWRSMSARSVAL